MKQSKYHRDIPNEPPKGDDQLVMPWMKHCLLNIINGRWGEKYEDEIAAIWWTRGDIESGQDIELTDEEWAEIAGRFNEMDWQYVSEEIDELVYQVINRRDTKDE
jgi:hypothetical protein